MHTKFEKVSFCYKEYKIQNIPLPVLQLFLYVSMSDRGQLINLLENIHVHNLLVLFVLRCDCTRISFYLSGTYCRQLCEGVFCGFIWWAWQGRHIRVFSCFSHIPSLWWERALQLEHFLTAGLHHCRIIFFQVIPLYILLWNPTGCLLSSALTSEYWNQQVWWEWNI